MAFAGLGMAEFVPQVEPSFRSDIQAQGHALLGNLEPLEFGVEVCATLRSQKVDSRCAGLDRVTKHRPTKSSEGECRWGRPFPVRMNL